MKLTSVNRGKARIIASAPRLGETGIYKQALNGKVEITAAGLAGDAVCDQKNHGGPDQAIYIYGSSDYDWWGHTLGRQLEAGTFGENLTVSGLESAKFSVGDRLHAGTVMLEVTAPRIPCGTLAARMGEPGFVKRFRAAERPGLYCRVLHPGHVRKGDAVSYEPFPGETVTILEMFRDHYQTERTEASLRRFLAAPVAIRARREKEEQLRQLLAAGKG